ALLSCSRCCVCFRLARRNANFIAQTANGLGQTACVGLVGRPGMAECTDQSAANGQVSRHLEVRSSQADMIRPDAPRLSVFPVPPGSAFLFFSKGCDDLSARTN
ncbi:MAG: hypothetical protein Q7T78_03230, partial [Rhodoferax sp.]|nr:hypothetical protein [Rhodoferax sp.]